MLGVDIAANLVEAGNARARSLGLANCRFQEGDASDLDGIDDASFDLVVSIFGAMFAPRPIDVAKEMVRVTRPGGRIVMGNWIPGDPTLVAQILQDQLRLLAAAAGGVRQPDDVGRRGERDRALRRRRRARGGQISFERDTYTFNFPGTPSEFLAEFRSYYGPTMNAYAAAAADGREDELHARARRALQRAEHERERRDHLDSRDVPARHRRRLRPFPTRAGRWGVRPA